MSIRMWMWSSSQAKQAGGRLGGRRRWLDCRYGLPLALQTAIAPS
jgi:hypothetical protein